MVVARRWSGCCHVVDGRRQSVKGVPMWDKVKTVHVDEAGREIVRWHETSDLDAVARALLDEQPHGVLEIKLV